MRKFFSCVAAVALLSGAVSLSAQEKKPTLTPDQKAIQGLQKELAGLDAEQVQINAKLAELEKTSERLAARVEVTVTGAEVWKRMKVDFDRRWKVLEQRVRDHNVSCQGTFQDKAFVERCNAEAAALNAEAAPLNAENERLDTTRKGMLEGAAQIKREMDAHLQAANENLARQEALHVRRLEFRVRVMGFLEDLKKREKLSKDCRDLAKLDKLEQASDCLQKVWDGAK